MSASTCPIVGVGASAGGLEALKVLFKALPVDTGAAFVVIQHLDPKHESLTAEILSRSTTMPTVQITNGMAVEANHVYVIPPNAYLTLTNNSFQLDEPVLHHGLRMPIDTFLWSLAEQHAEHAIAIIVSGTGCDGTLGLRAVKGGGGLVLAQTPETAQYDGMPRSAIASGSVDVVCAVEAMPEHLIAYLQHPYISKQIHSTQSAPVAKDDSVQLSAILSLLHTRTGHDFRVYKHGTLLRRISRRMGLHHIETMTDYLTFLRAQEDEATILFKDLLIGVTAFFRDPDAFAALEKNVIAPLVEAKHNDEAIRVWVPACATGEEAYSIAMALIEHLDQAHKHCPLQVFASDIDDAALAVARSGLYPENIAASLSPERLQRFFTKEDHSYRVKQLLRESITFAAQNLISDPPFTNLDLISCRNVLIYLNSDVQRKVLALFYFALHDGGCLYLGHSETASQQETLFEPLAKQWRIYRRSSSVRPPNVDFPISSRINRSTLPSTASIANSGLQLQSYSKEHSRFSEITHQHLLQEFAPAAVLVNQQYQILYFSGPTSRYLEQPSGIPTHDLFTLARHELRPKLRIALRRVADQDQRVTMGDVVLTRGKDRVRVKVSMKPIKVPKLADTLVLITFEDCPEESLSPPDKQDKKTANLSSDKALIQQIEDELHATREDLQSNIEELESANEELQAANEEVMSVNEELQSSNEEMESSKEELQSMNEELTTVNNQYKDKVEELAKSNDDVTNLLSSTNIATVFVDTELRIGRFTPATEGMLNLISTDIGRPLSDIRPKFIDSYLLDDVQRVLDKLSPVESEVTTESGDCYIRRILPYRTSDNHIAGAVITFIDISERKHAEEQARRLATVVRDSNDAVTLQNLQGNITAWNRGAEKLYGWSEQEALKKNICDILPESSHAKVPDLIKRIVEGERVSSIETQRVTKDGRKLAVWLTITPLRDQRGQIVAIATTERDISERRHADDTLRKAKKEAELALAAKSRFLATASHDLRQPLQSLNLLNKILLKTIDEPEAQKMLTMQGESLAGMSQLLISLLNISKLESGNVDVDIKAVALGPIFTRMRTQFEKEANEKGLQLIIDPTSERVQSDPILLAQVIQNLLSNAIRYTHKGFVELSCIHDKGGLKIEVKDSGIGIPNKQLKHIFNEFYQIDRDPQKRNAGLGLGLAIVQRIALLLGTHVDVTSTVGKGSSFSISLEPSNTEADTKGSEAAKQEELALTNKEATLLLIDDDPAVLDASRMLLSLEEGFEIITAASPPEAYAKLDTFIPDLIITDFHLNHKESGLDIIRSIRQRLKRTIPAIIVTGDTSKMIDKLELADLEIMTKPIDADQLITLSRRLLSATSSPDLG